MERLKQEKDQYVQNSVTSDEESFMTMGKSNTVNQIKELATEIELVHYKDESVEHGNGSETDGST